MMQGRGYLAGLVTGIVVTAAIGAIGMTVAARGAGQAPGAPTSKPEVKVLLENAQVRVRQVDFAPGAGDTHTHPWAHVGVIMTKDSTPDPQFAQPTKSAGVSSSTSFAPWIGRERTLGVMTGGTF